MAKRIFILNVKATRSESVMVSMLLAGDKRSYDFLYDNYSSILYGHILRIVKDEEVANKVLCNSFLKIIESVKLYDASKFRFLVWMLNICRNCAEQFSPSSDRNLSPLLETSFG